MLRTITCFFEDSAIAEAAVASLCNQFKGSIRIQTGGASGLLQSAVQPFPPQQTVMISCCHDIFDQVVHKAGVMGAEKILY